MNIYNVILKKDVDFSSFWEDMETETEGLLFIPNRRVEYTNQRVGSLRQCWYKLTEQEADLIKEDSRVLEVEIPPEFRDDLIIYKKAIQESDFSKTSSTSGSFVNWGLKRCLDKNNNYGTNSFIDSIFPYTLTGRGVDVVIQDSGIQIDHPEFQDENGNSRFESIDWGSFSSGSFTQSSNHDRDLDGHGTHVAGIACGKTFGWAKNSKVLHQKIAGLEGSGDSGNGIPPTYAFDAIKAWHTNKPIDPELGYKRPTVVNMSWGYLTTYQGINLQEINYRNISYSGSAIDSPAEVQNNFGLIINAFSGSTLFTLLRIPSVDTDIEEMIDAGIVVCIAPGNSSFKVDVEGGTDYNNFYNAGNGNIYYHRGGSPFSSEAIIIGNIDSNPHSEFEDQKNSFSETGPGVDIYAPGTNIMSCTSSTNKFTDTTYYLNSNFRQCNLSGTSMACPQVTGIVACYLELNYNHTPNQVKSWLTSKAGTAIYNTGTGDDWSNFRSLKDGNLLIARQPFTDFNPLTVTGVSTTATFNLK